MAYSSSDLARSRILENPRMRRRNTQAKIRNERSLLSDTFTDMIFPMIAPILEKIRSRDEAEFDLSNISLE